MTREQERDRKRAYRARKRAEASAVALVQRPSAGPVATVVPSRPLPYGGTLSEGLEAVLRLVSDADPMIVAEARSIAARLDSSDLPDGTRKGLGERLAVLRASMTPTPQVNMDALDRLRMERNVDAFEAGEALPFDSPGDRERLAAFLAAAAADGETGVQRAKREERERHPWRYARTVCPVHGVEASLEPAPAGRPGWVWFHGPGACVREPAPGEVPADWEGRRRALVRAAA